MRPEDREDRIKEAQELREGYKAMFKSPAGEHLLKWIEDSEAARIDAARTSRTYALSALDEANGIKRVLTHIRSMLGKVDES